MNNLTAIVLTKNEEKNLEECLDSIKFADEVIIIDDNSTDKTCEIAEKNKAKVIKNSLKSFSSQRNFGLENASNEWVLFIDADERVDKGLVSEIKEKINQDKFDGFYIKRVDVFLGREMRYGDLGNVWLMRLGKKDKGKWVGDIHEVWEIDGRTAKMKSPIIHKSHKNIEHFIRKLNSYSSIRAKELKEKGVKSSFVSIIFYPKVKFIYLYILKFGFRDGIYGFIHAIFMSFYSFLVRGKLYLLHANNK